MKGTSLSLHNVTQRLFDRNHTADVFCRDATSLCYILRPYNAMAHILSPLIRMKIAPFCFQGFLSVLILGKESQKLKTMGAGWTDA